MRRTRVANCPECGQTVPLDRAKPRTRRNGDMLIQRLAFTVCVNCYRVFNNDNVESWLKDLGE